MKPKFTYQSYDYSFLLPKNSWRCSYMPHAVEVAAQTIGFDMTTVEPMNEPVGQLFYFEPTTSTTTTGDGQITATTAVYEPITYGAIADVSNHITMHSSKGPSNYIITNTNVSRALKNAEIDRRRAYRAKLFAKRNFFKILRSKRHG